MDKVNAHSLWYLSWGCAEYVTLFGGFTRLIGLCNLDNCKTLLMLYDQTTKYTKYTKNKEELGIYFSVSGV